MTPLQFTPGKFYKTRDGRKALLTGNGYNFRSGSSMVAILSLDGYDCIRTFMADGRFHCAAESDHDLIAEWKDAPSVDWSKMPEGANFVVSDSSGRWFATEHEPRILATCWIADLGTSWRIYPQHIPKWSGDWRESLVTREAQP